MDEEKEKKELEMEDELLKKYQETKSLKETYSQALQELKEFTEKEQNQVIELTKTMIEETRFSQYDYVPELFKEYLKEPYVISPVKEGVWRVAVPKFVRFNIGFFEYSTDTYNVFLVDRIASFFGEIPRALEDKFKFKDRLDLKIFDGILFTGIEHQDEVWTRYTKHLSRREGSDRIRIKRGHEFNLQGKLLKDGILPYFTQPIPKEQLRDPKVDFDLYDFQKEAWETFLQKGAAGIYWLMGSGKTFLGLYALASIKGKKLVVVPSATLVEQWKNRLRVHTSIAHEVKVVTYQLLTHATSKHAAAVKKQEYSLIIFDECLTGDTTIVLEDGGIKTIDKIRDGSMVVGGRVSNKFSRNSPTILQIKTSFGELKTTTTHPHIMIKRKFNKHLNQFDKLLDKDLKTIQANNLIVGDCLLVPEFLPHTVHPHTVKDDLIEKQLAFVALIICDGHIEKNTNSIKVCVSKNSEKSWMRKVFLDGIKSFDYNKFWEFTNSRGDYTIGCCNKRLKDILTKTYKIPAGKKSSNVDIIDKIFYSPKTSLKKFIDIAFSCEGWISHNKTNILLLSMASQKFIEKIQLLLKKFGIHSYFLHIKRRHKNHSDLFRLSVSGKDFNTFFEKIGLTHPLKTLKAKEHINQKTKHMNDSVLYRDKKYRIAKIKEIKQLPREKVYDFETTSHTFLANGFLTHNCHHLPANTYEKLALLKTDSRIGLSATPFREDGNSWKIIALTGYPLGMNWEELFAIGIVKKPDIILYLGKTLQDKKQKLKELLDIPLKTVVFCDSIDLGKRLSKQFEYPFVHGETNPKERIDIIDSSSVCIVSRVGDQGLSLDIPRVIEFDFFKGSRRQEIQRMGRVMHSGKKGQHIILMTYDEYDSHHKRIDVLEEKGLRVSKVSIN